jgi:D-threo-aldose 1-dehydrogenase
MDAMQTGKDCRVSTDYVPTREDRVPLMYLHDPEYHLAFAEAMAPDGPVRALTELREAGLLGHLGIAGGPVGLMRDFIATGEFEVVLNHHRFTVASESWLN